MATITIGYSDTSGTLMEYTSGSSNAGRCMTAPETYDGYTIVRVANEGDVLKKFSVYTRDTNTGDTGQEIGIALYELVAGVPVNRAHPEVVLAPILTTAHWLDSDELSYPLTAGVTYAIAVRTNLNTSSFARLSVSTNNVSRDNRTGALNSPYVENGRSSAIYLVTYDVETGSGGDTGDLDATESGSDTASATGTVLVQGSLGATETGSDTANFSGSSSTSGTLAATESGNDSAAATGTVLVQGSLTVSESGSDSFAATSSGEIIIDDDYERSSVNVDSSFIEGAGDDAVISLYPRKVDCESTGLRWMEPSARITNINGLKPTFRFLLYASGQLHGYPWPTTKRCMYSYDFVTWHYFDNMTLVAGEYAEFSHDTAFTENVVYIARSRQVKPSQVGQWIETMAAAYPSMFVPSPTAAAFTPTLTSWPGQDFIADEYSEQTDELDRTIPQTPLYGVMVNDTSLMPADGTPKLPFFFPAGIHAGEDIADVVFMRVFEFLCSDDAAAQEVRRYYYVIGIPCLNAPGRYGGSWRSGFHQGTSGADDAARHFSDTLGAGLETVLKPRAAMLNDMGELTPVGFLDLHGTYINNWSDFKDTALETLFHNRYVANTGFTIADEGNSNAGSIGGWGQNVLGCQLANTIEYGDRVPQSDANYVTAAEGLIKSINDLRVSGDLITGAIYLENTGTMAATETGSDTAAINHEPEEPEVPGFASFKSVSTVADQSSGTTLATSAAADVVSGNFLLLFVHVFGTELYPTTPSGWTQMGTVYYWGGGASFAVYRRLADGTSDDAPTLTLASARHWQAWIGCFEGQDGEDPIGDNFVIGLDTDTTVDHPSLDATSDGSLAIICAASYVSETGTFSFTNDFTPRLATVANGNPIYLCTKDVDTGAIGATEATNTTNMLRHGTFTAIINPAEAVSVAAGDLDAAESGSDTCASSGTVLVQGSLAATETGNDTASIIAGTVTHGSVSATESGSDTATISGDVLIQGALTATESGSDTAAFSGSSLIAGTLAATESGNDSAAATGSILVQGDLSATETGSDTAHFSGASVITGTVSATESGADTYSATGSVVIHGTFAVSETGSDGLASTGKVFVKGAIAANESGNDTFHASGSPNTTGNLNAQESGSDTCAAAGVVIVAGTLTATESGQDGCAVVGIVKVQGGMAANESGYDTFAATNKIITIPSWIAYAKVIIDDTYIQAVI